jgi:hypothetical protein
MENPLLGKLILLKLPLPPDAQMEIKKFFRIPTPTALLIKALTFERSATYTVVSGRHRRVHVLHGRWAHPPLLPAIQHIHKYSKEGRTITRGWDLVTGEPLGGRVPRYEVMWLRWPRLEPNQLHTGDTYLVDTAEDMARQVRSWTPVRS